MALDSEIQMLSQLKHKNIVKYIGKRNDGNTYSIFLEYVAGGSIHSLLQKYGRFTEPLIRIYTKNILEGLEYLHANHVIHRDIKGANVLVDGNGSCKLADFRNAKRLLENQVNTGNQNTFIGTAYWMAPEVIK